MSISQSEPTWNSVQVNTESPYEINIDSSSVVEWSVDNGDNTSTYYLKYSGTYQNQGTDKAGTKYLGFSFDTQANAGSYLRYKTHNSSAIPENGTYINKNAWTTLNGADFTYKDSYVLKNTTKYTYSTDIDNNTIATPYYDIETYKNIYYKSFASIPKSTYKDFEVYVKMDSKPSSFIMYFGTGSTIVQLTKNGVLNVNITGVTTPYQYQLNGSNCRVTINSTILNYTENLSASACSFDIWSNTNRSVIFTIPEIKADVHLNPTNVYIEDFANTSLANGLVGYWAFGKMYSSGVNSVSATDYSGMGNTGTLTNMNMGIDNGSSGWTTSGKFGNAMQFDGVNDYVNIPISTSLNLFGNESVTVSFYFKPSMLYDTSTLTQDIELLRAGTSTYYLIRIEDSAPNRGTVRFMRTSTTHVASAQTNWSKNVWYQAVGVYNKTDMMIYINGVLSNITHTTSSIFDIDAPLTLGGLGAAGQFNGSMDEVRIYNRALSQSEITQLYRLGNKYLQFNTTDASYIGNKNITVTPNFAGKGTLLNITNTAAMSLWDSIDLWLNEQSITLNNSITYYTYWINGTVANISKSDNANYYTDTCTTGVITDMVGCWGFEEGYSNNATPVTNDRSGFNNDGTLTNMNMGIDNGSSGWTTSGKFGNGLQFDGTNDYINLPTVTTINTTKDFTVSAWINPRTVGNWEVEFISRNRYANGWELWLNQGKFSLDFASDIVGLKTIQTGQVITANNWQYVTAVIDTTHATQKQRVYVNGVLLSSANWTGIASSTGGIHLGKWVGGDSNYFNGSMDEVRIYNRSLSASEITSEYNRGKDRLLLTRNEEGAYSANSDWLILISNMSLGVTVTSTYDNHTVGITALAGSGVANVSVIGPARPMWRINNINTGDYLKQGTNYTYNKTTGNITFLNYNYGTQNFTVYYQTGTSVTPVQATAAVAIAAIGAAFALALRKKKAKR